MRKSLDQFTKPHNMYYLGCFNNNFKNITKINNKLCGYYYDGEYVKILNDKGEIINKCKIEKKKRY